MRKEIKRTVAVCMALITAAGSVTALAMTMGSGDEIDRRIEEVGKAYLDFYRNGQDEEYDMNFTSAAKSSGVNYLAAPMMDEEVSYEYEAAESYEVTSPAANFFIDASPMNTEEYGSVHESGFVSPVSEPFSTFGADVDTASYSSLRRKLLEPAAYDEEDPYGSYYAGPDDSAIRIEEMMNYFDYHYEEPKDGERFGITTRLAKCPWNEDSLLLMVGIKAEESREKSNGSNVVLLVDTSGSMFGFDSLPLVKKALNILVKNLGENDCVSLVTYAGSEEVVFEGLTGADQDEIMSRINDLEAWGSTYGEGGIEKAYEIAEKYFIEGGNNRVVLCTDGDFNVGTSSQAGLEELISKKRDTGVFFSCLGVGSGNYSDVTMETLADKGNGNYFYLDSEREAQKALDEEFESTFFTVAKDVKFQVEFNPDEIKGYRLVGYENRKMAAEDFADDTKDGGEVGSGQTVTVLYEIIPSSSDFEMPSVASKYGKKAEDETEPGEFEGELLTVSVRSKAPDSDTSDLQEKAVFAEDMEELSGDLSWAAGVVQAGMLMRDSEYAGTSSFDEIYNRLKEDDEVMDSDEKAEFLFMLRYMKKYCESRNADGIDF